MEFDWCVYKVTDSDYNPPPPALHTTCKLHLKICHPYAILLTMPPKHTQLLKPNQNYFSVVEWRRLQQIIYPAEGKTWPFLTMRCGWLCINKFNRRIQACLNVRNFAGVPTHLQAKLVSRVNEVLKGSSCNTIADIQFSISSLAIVS